MQVYQAELHVLRLLPWPKSWLYPLRPGAMWAILLATSGMAMAALGLVLAAVIAYVAKQSLYPSAQAADEYEYAQYASPDYPDELEDDEDLRSGGSFGGEMKGRLSPVGSYGRLSGSADSQHGGSRQELGQVERGRRRPDGQASELYGKNEAPGSPFSDEQQQRDGVAEAWERVDADASVFSNVTGAAGVEAPAGSSAAAGAEVVRSGSGGVVRRRGFSLFSQGT